MLVRVKGFCAGLLLFSLTSCESDGSKASESSSAGQQEECSCLNQDELGSGGAGALTICEQPLEALCEGGMCPGSYDDLNRAAGYWVEEVGCGRRCLRREGGFSGNTYCFDSASGELFGIEGWSDVPSEGCGYFGVRAGQLLDGCADVAVCDWGSSSLADYPDCPL